MGKIDITKARVYVCTDKKCSKDNFKGRWLDLINYKSKAEFVEACKNAHSDEEEPRYLYFDYEDLPYVYINQYWIEPKMFELLRAVVEQDAILHPAFSAWLNHYKPDLAERDISKLVETFKTHFEGPFQSSRKYAIYYAREHLNILSEKNPDFDFSSLANFLFKEDFVFLEGYVFKKTEFK